MKIALTGATGFVGSTVLDQALAAGHEILALTRRDQAEREGVTWLRGELADQAALARLASGADAMLHIAGVVGATDLAEFEAGNVTGTRNVIAACEAAGVSRLVFVSSLAAREPELSAYGASKARAEALVRETALDWTIVRPPAVYGPRDTELFEMFKMAKRGLVPVPREGRVSMIHVEDLARLLLALTSADKATHGATYEPDDGVTNGWSHRGVAKAIGDAVGKRARTVGLAPWMLGLGARLDTLFRGSKAKLTPDRARYIAHPDWVVSDAARPPASLWQPQVETRNGLAQTARWYRDEGWL